jgi:hypothetical protein
MRCDGPLLLLAAVQPSGCPDDASRRLGDPEYLDPGLPGHAGDDRQLGGKAAIRSLARSPTAALAGKGIRVNALAPGLIDTDVMRKLGISEEMIAQMNARFRSRIPMGRIGTGDDIARFAPFLASGEAGSVTGVELAVDGGHAQV